jgi:RecA-family ATPase
MNSPLTNKQLAQFEKELDIPFGNDPQLKVVNNEADYAKYLPKHFASDFGIVRPAPLVRDLLPKQGLVMISGSPKAGKTFVAMDIMLSIASGQDFWLDRKISKKSREGIIIYISAEGTADFQSRKEAFAIEKNWTKEQISSIRFYDVKATPNLRDTNELRKIIKAFTTLGMPIIAIVVDTVHRTIGGDINDFEEATEYVAACDVLQKEFQTLIVIVHHVGKDREKGSMGSTALIASVDCEIRVEFNENDKTRSISTLNPKIFPLATNFYYFNLKVVTVGKDEEKNDITSCVIGKDENAMKEVDADKAKKEAQQKAEAAAKYTSAKEGERYATPSF